MSLFHSPQTCGASASSLTCCELQMLLHTFRRRHTAASLDLCSLLVQAQRLVSVSGWWRQRDTEQHPGLSVELWGGGVYRHLWRSQRLHHPSAGEEQELENERDRVPQTPLAVRQESALSAKSEGCIWDHHNPRLNYLLPFPLYKRAAASYKTLQLTNHLLGTFL